MNTSCSTETLYELYIACQQQLTTDTRKLIDGSIFFALKGEHFDANTFAEKAIEGGCAYAIVDNEHIANGETILLVKDVLESLQQLAKLHRKRLAIPVIGITGSNGKTTHKELIHAVLSKKYKAFATKGNLNNHIGVPLSILSLTPQHEIAVIEMGANHQGEIAMLSDIADPDFGIITNIGKAHLEGFGGEEGIKKGKGELYQHLKQKSGPVFMNGDDAVLLELAGEMTKIFYGQQPRFDVYGQNVSHSEYLEFKWHTKEKPLDAQPIIKTQLFGHYNLINVLGAACVGHYFKVPEQDINQALSEYVPEMNRSQVKKTNFNTLILDAYNANPSSMTLAIEHFTKQSYSRQWMLLGDMFELGAYATDEHRKIIELLSKHSTIQVAFIGKHFFALKENYSHRAGYHFFETIETAKAYFSTNKIIDATVFIKGSRAIKLESLVEFL